MGKSLVRDHTESIRDLCVTGRKSILSTDCPIMCVSEDVGEETRLRRRDLRIEHLRSTKSLGR